MVYVFLIIAVWAIINANHKVLFSLIVISLVAEVIRFNLVGSMQLSNVVGFIVLPFVIKNWKIVPQLNGIISSTFYIQANLLVLFLIFGILFPWEDLSGYRAWGQQSFGRGLITSVRLINEFIIFYYIIILFRTKKVTLDFFLSVFIIMTTISFFVAIIDKVEGYQIVRNLFYFREDLAGRFVGLNGEPKVFGRANALAFAIVWIFKERIKFHVILLILTSIGTFISLSASSLIMYFIFIFVIFLIQSRKKVGQVGIVTIIILGGIFILPNVLEMIPNQYGTTDKIKQVIGESEDDKRDAWVKDETFISKRFDIFDRLALIYLIKNPKHLVYGVGPNLISIPASEYIPQNTIYAEENRIDSVPNNFINNTISSGGIVYLGFWLFFLFRIWRYVKSCKYSKLLFVVTVVLNMVFFSSIFYILCAVSIGLVLQSDNSKLMINA